MANDPGWSEEELRKLVDATSQVKLAESPNEENQEAWDRVVELMGTSRSVKAVKARWRRLVKSDPSLQPEAETEPPYTRSACSHVANSCRATISKSGMKPGFLLTGGKLGAPTSSACSPKAAVGRNDAASKPKATVPKNTVSKTAAERCRDRLAACSPEKRSERDNRMLTLGEQVIRNPLIRDGILKHFNPWKRSDLQRVMELRCFYGVLPDEDLKVCYFKEWHFDETDFPLANWRGMSIEEMKKKVKDAHRQTPVNYVKSLREVEIGSLRSKEAILKAYRALTFVPRDIFLTAVGSGEVLRKMAAGTFGGGGKFEEVVDGWFLACCAGLNDFVIRWCARWVAKNVVNQQQYVSWAVSSAVFEAMKGGQNHVLDILAAEYGAALVKRESFVAAASGHNSTIDHLVHTYGVDLHAMDSTGWYQVHRAAWRGHTHTVTHLVEVYGVDVRAKTRDGQTALDIALRNNYTACAQALRKYASAAPRSRR